MLQKRAFVFSCVLCLGLAAGWAQSVKLTIVSPGPGHPMYEIAKKVLPEAAKAINGSIEIIDVPPNRAGLMFDAAEVDGFIFADNEFLKQHPGAVRVDTPLGYDEMLVLTKSLTFKPDGWASLKPYRIGFMYSMAVVENNIKGMKTDGAQSPPQALDKLMADRTDVVVLPRFLFEAFKSAYPQVKALEPPIEKVALYTFLTAKRADFARKLADALTDMQKKGRIKAITDEVRSGIR